MISLLEAQGQSGLAVDDWMTWKLREPPLSSPLLQTLSSTAVDIIFVEQIRHLSVPLVYLGLLGPSDLDPVEVDEVLTVAVERPDVDDAEPDSVELPVRQFAALVGATIPNYPGLGQIQFQLLEVLHVQTETRDID